MSANTGFIILAILIPSFAWKLCTNKYSTEEDNILSSTWACVRTAVAFTPAVIISVVLMLLIHPIKMSKVIRMFINMLKTEEEIKANEISSDY